MGLVPMRDPAILRERGYANVSAGRPFVFLRYLRPDGTPYYKNKDPYELVRFLGPVKMWRGETPPPKAISPGGRPPVLHFEPIGGGQDWTNLPDGTIVIHLESMVKAKVVHKWLDLPCVGLNGVWGWASSKMGVELTYVDTGVDFSRFKNVILFDSNTHKPDVAKARQSLAFKLRNVLGCKEVYIADLPRPTKKEWDEEDWGPDDFMAVKRDPNLLSEVISTAEPFVGSLDDPLIEALRDRIVFCTATGTIIDRGDKVVRDVAKATEMYRPINRKELMGKSVKTTYAFQLWRDDPSVRREVIGPCYKYLGDEFVEKPDGEYYNLYKKGGAWPAGERTGAADAAIKQIYNMLGDEGAERFRTYFRFLKFTAYKPCTLLVMYGGRGVGKGWATKMVDRLIGRENCAHARGKDLSSNFNAILQAKRLIILNEYTPEGNRQTALNAIKGLAGDEYIVIEPKGMDPYRLENNAGAIFTTNFLSDVPTDGLEDRRLVYLEANNRVEVPQEQWRSLHDMLDGENSEEVMADLAQWLWEGEEIDYGTWKPDPLDSTRQEAILDSSQGPVGTARVLLHRMRQAGYTCLWMDTIQELFEEEGHPKGSFSAIRLSSILKHGDWTSSKERYGSPKQRLVYIVDMDKFKKIESDKTAVRDEADRTARELILPPKF